MTSLCNTSSRPPAAARGRLGLAPYTTWARQTHGKQAPAQRHCRPSSSHLAPRRQPALIRAVAAPDMPAAKPRRSTALDDVVVVAAVRTAMCKAQVGKLKDAPMDDLVIAVVKDLLSKTGVKAQDVEDVCFGSGLGPSSKRANEVRTALLLAGFPNSVPAYTVNRQCAAGLQSIADVAANIAAGYISIGIAGGVESMSKSPMKWEGSENPRLEEVPEAKDCLTPMGITSDNVAKQFKVSREEQDRAALASHRKAAAAQAAGKFKEEIVPVETIAVMGDGQTEKIVVDTDEGIRPDFTYEKLAKLRGCFQKGGTTTAANSCQTTDGAAAVILMRRDEAARRGLPVMATLRSFAAVGVPPSVMGIGPAAAIPRALERAGLTKDDIDVFEINEAFASQYAYCKRELGLPDEKVNPNGGAIALGHPIGCSGARQTVTLLHELARRNNSSEKHEGPRYGVVSMCVGSGMGAAAVFETNGAPAKTA